MSSVTNVILHAPLDSEEYVARLNSWLEQHGYGHLIEVSDHAGGSKAMECLIWMAAFNHFEGTLPAFVEAAQRIDAEYRARERHVEGWRFQLLVMGAEEDVFTERLGALGIGGPAVDQENVAGKTE